MQSSGRLGLGENGGNLGLQAREAGGWERGKALMESSFLLLQRAYL